MPRKAPPWWQNFQILAWVVGGLTALGTIIVFVANYITLPAKVEAGEQKNQEQDRVLLKQTAILDVLKEVYQQDVRQRQEDEEWLWDARARNWVRKPPKPQ